MKCSYGLNNSLTITNDVSMSSSNITEHTDQRTADVNEEETSSKLELLTIIMENILLVSGWMM